MHILLCHTLVVKKTLEVVKVPQILLKTKNPQIVQIFDQKLVALTKFSLIEDAFQFFSVS